MQQILHFHPALECWLECCHRQTHVGQIDTDHNQLRPMCPPHGLFIPATNEPTPYDHAQELLSVERYVLWVMDNTGSCNVSAMATTQPGDEIARWRVDYLLPDGEVRLFIVEWDCDVLEFSVRAAL